MSVGQAGLSWLFSTSSKAGRSPWRLVCHLKETFEPKGCTHNVPSPKEAVGSPCGVARQRCGEAGVENEGCNVGPPIYPRERQLVGPPLILMLGNTCTVVTFSHH